MRWSITLSNKKNLYAKIGYEYYRHHRSIKLYLKENDFGYYQWLWCIILYLLFVPIIRVKDIKVDSKRLYCAWGLGNVCI